MLPTKQCCKQKNFAQSLLPGQMQDSLLKIVVTVYKCYRDSSSAIVACVTDSLRGLRKTSYRSISYMVPASIFYAFIRGERGSYLYKV